MNNGNIMVDANREYIERECILNRNIDLYHVTTCFDQSRFYGSEWAMIPYGSRRQKVDATIPDLIYKFRKWYISGILKNASFDYRRKRTRTRQPDLFGYVHDNEDNSARPHFHSIMKTDDIKIKNWIESDYPNKLWKSIEPLGGINIRKFPLDQLSAVNGYASSYYVSRSYSMDCDNLHFHFPLFG